MVDDGANAVAGGLGITATDGGLYPRVEARIQPGGDVLGSADVDHRFP
jgi:hypothetical protein